MEKVLVGLIALFALFFTQVTPERVERELERALRQSLTAQQVDAELDGAPGFPTLRGKFRKLTVTIKGLQFQGGQLLELLPVGFTAKPVKEGRIGEVHLLLKDTVYEGLLIADLQAHARSVRFDMKGSLREKRLVLVSASEGEMKGVVAADALQRYLTERLTREGVESPQVWLRRGSVEVEGRWRVEFAGMPLMRVPFSATAELFPLGNEVHWRLRDAYLADLVPLPTGWLQERFKAFNPLIRFDLAPLEVRLHSLLLTPKGAQFTATFSLSPPKPTQP